MGNALSDTWYCTRSQLGRHLGEHLPLLEVFLIAWSKQ